MFDVAGSLQPALTRAAANLSRAANEAALSQTTGGSGARDAAMAKLAEQAIFSEALLDAIRARLQEVKSVAK